MLDLNSSLKYKTIYADPPWNEIGGGKIKRGADRHYKLMKTKDIVDLPVGLDFINKLRPVKFKWAIRDVMENNPHQGTVKAGFIAQDFVAAQVGSEYLDLVMDENPDKFEARQGNLIPVLVQAIKDLATKVTALEAG